MKLLAQPPLPWMHRTNIPAVLPGKVLGTFVHWARVPAARGTDALHHHTPLDEPLDRPPWPTVWPTSLKNTELVTVITVRVAPTHTSSASRVDPSQVSERLFLLFFFFKAHQYDDWPPFGGEFQELDISTLPLLKPSYQEFLHSHERLSASTPRRPADLVDTHTELRLLLI